MVDNDKPLLIITARVGSSRLPGKVLMPFCGQYSLLEFLIRRLQAFPETSRLVLATVTTPENDPVAEIGKKCGVKVIRGAEDNVLERMDCCLKGEVGRYVGRITADNPFTDPALFILQWEEMKRIKADYSYCKESPKGSSADIWTVECFKSSVKNASTPYELEHVNAWVWDHPELYKVLWFVPPSIYISPELSLSIDTNAEFVLVSKYAMCFENTFRVNVSDIIKLCNKNRVIGKRKGKL